MATFLNANLPSDDEEDDEYDPSKDPTGEKDDSVAARRSKRPRRAAAAAAGADDGPAGGRGSDSDGDAGAILGTAETRTQQVKKARAAVLFEQLQGKAGDGGAKAPAAVAAGAGGSGGGGGGGGGAAKPLSLAELCRPVSQQQRVKKAGGDELWMRNLGLAPAKPKPAAAAAGAPAASLAASVLKAARGGAEPSLPPEPAAAPGGAAAAAAEAGPSGSGAGEGGGGGDAAEEARAAASAALAAAKEAASLGVARSYNKVTVTETRRFAGKDIEVKLQVEAGSKAAQKAAATAKADTGIERFLQEIEKKKKVNVLDKTKMDWQDLKAGDAALEEELEAHKRSGAQYLDRQEFLKRTELREYEIERDKRLASDIRTRGRM